MDEALISELREIIKTFKVNPSFQYIIGDMENAGALPDPLDRQINPGTSGIVLIGLDLVRTLMRQKEGAAVAGICAHECGHIYQFNSKPLFFSTVCTNGFYSPSDDCRRSLELHADFLAGYYMGRRKDWAADQLKMFTDAIIKLAEIRGYRQEDQSSHGTLEQRIKAINKGHEIAGQRPIFTRDVAILGENYIRNI